MKTTTLSGILLLIIWGFFACTGTGPDSTKNKANLSAASTVEVYYFHFTKRCNTCQSVEATAKKVMEMIYVDKNQTKAYDFKSINLDEAENKAIAEKWNAGGQALMVRYGNKIVDITDKGFLYAHEPEKMKTIIKNAIDQVTKS